MTLFFKIPCFLLWSFHGYSVVPTVPGCVPNHSISRWNIRHFSIPQILLALLILSWKSNNIFSLLISEKCLHCKKTINHCASSLNSHLSSMEQLCSETVDRMDCFLLIVQHSALEQKLPQPSPANVYVSKMMFLKQNLRYLRYSYFLPQTSA